MTITSEAPYAAGAEGRIGLCCEKGASIASTKKSEAWHRSADVYARMVEDALNSTNPEAITKLLDEQAKVFATKASKEEALKNLRADYKRNAEWKHRFVRCDADIDTYTRSFECDTVMTRTMACRDQGDDRVPNAIRVRRAAVDLQGLRRHREDPLAVGAAAAAAARDS